MEDLYKIYAKTDNTPFECFGITVTEEAGYDKLRNMAPAYTNYLIVGHNIVGDMDYVVSHGRIENLRDKGKVYQKKGKK